MMRYHEWAELSEAIMTMPVKEETYQDDMRYERAVWPEKFGALPDGLNSDASTAMWKERILLALQGIDISLEKIAGSKPSLAALLSSDDESA
jgi:hypothetical protein